MDPESILKGRMAESLVSEILREAGNQVYRFGYESILQNLTQTERIFDRYSEIGEKIRAIPDLLVINKKGEPFFIEVKFRWHREWHEDDFKMLDRLNHFWKPIIVFVNCHEKPYFLTTESPYRDKNNKLTGKPLEEADYLGVSKDLLEKYCALIEKYFTPTLKKTKNV